MGNVLLSLKSKHPRQNLPGPSLHICGLHSGDTIWEKDWQPMIYRCSSTPVLLFTCWEGTPAGFPPCPSPASVNHLVSRVLNLSIQHKCCCHVSPFAVALLHMGVQVQTPGQVSSKSLHFLTAVIHIVNAESCLLLRQTLGPTSSMSSTWRVQSYPTFIDGIDAATIQPQGYGSQGHSSRGAASHLLHLLPPKKQFLTENQKWCFLALRRPWKAASQTLRMPPCHQGSFVPVRAPPLRIPFPQGKGTKFTVNVHPQPLLQSRMQHTTY